MSISRCQYCGTQYDQDYNVEHEDECELETLEEHKEVCEGWLLDK